MEHHAFRLDPVFLHEFFAFPFLEPLARFRRIIRAGGALGRLPVGPHARHNLLALPIKRRTKPLEFAVAGTGDGCGNLKQRLGDWQSANDELEEITPAVRAASGVLLVRVEIYLRAGKPEMAQPVAQTLARTRGADWRAHYSLAQAEARLGNFKAAQAALERAFALRDVRQKALDDPLLETLWTNLN